MPNTSQITPTVVSCFGGLVLNKDVFSLDSYASDELKNDREMVLAAVNKNGAYLRYVSDEFKNDREIVTAAISKEPSAIKYASEKLQIEFDQ